MGIVKVMGLIVAGQGVILLCNVKANIAQSLIIPLKYWSSW